MIALRKKFIIWLTVIVLILGWSVYGGLNNYLPKHYFEWYPFIPVYFYVLGLSFILVICKYEKKKPEKVAQVYLLIKTVKILISMLFIGIYALAVKIQRMDFLITFLLFYFTYLIFETIFFYRFEKTLKNEQ